MTKARFITVEGGEGVGKSTFIKNLSTKLGELGVNHILSREPGGTPLADQIREVFTYPAQNEVPSKITELFLVAASRAQHLSQKIIPTLESGQWVVCDRFSDSTRVYQGGFLNNQETVESVLKIAEQGVSPDLTLLLDCPVDILQARLSVRSKTDKSIRPSRYDLATAPIHEKIRNLYLELAKKYSDRVVVIDASRTPEETVNQAIKILKDNFL